MYFETNDSVLYTDTMLPDIFITEYMLSMEADYVKVYIYCLFLSKHRKQATAEELSKKLALEPDRVKEAFLYLESIGVIIRKDKGIVLNDLKEKEIQKMYRPKLTSTPEEAALSSERNKARYRTVSAINNAFFQGLMSPSWYTDIDAWFDKYRFEEDVMYALFQHCYNHKALTKAYLTKVADNWFSKGIRNNFDLDSYSIEYQKIKDIRLKIVKKLKKQSLLTEYEEAYLEKWVVEYGYSFDIIELALKRTTSIANPNFEYINRIIAEWNEKGLKCHEEIMEYEKQRKLSSGRAKKEDAIPQKNNYKQRKYSKEHYEKFYNNA